MDYLSMDRSDLGLRNQQTSQNNLSGFIGLQSSSASRSKNRQATFYFKLQCQVSVNKEPYSFELVKQIFAKQTAILTCF